MIKSETFTFKRGSEYSRNEIHSLYFGKPVPRIGTGNWTTGYVQPKGSNDLIIFMNIGVPGRTGQDFDNKFDHQTNTIVWYGKPNTHAGQPTFQKLFSKELKPHFFARWDSQNTKFLYLGTGSIVNFQEGVQTKQGSAIRLVLTCDEAKDILDYSTPELGTALDNTKIDEDKINESNISQRISENTPSSFLLEKHLESYIEKYWKKTIFGNEYDIYKNGRQYPTETGPLDLLAYRKDKTEFLVLELKRDKTSDVAVAQTLRYMGYVKKTLATKNEMVRGCIIGTHADQNLENAISMVPDIDFYRYNLSFSLDKIEF
jgi:hypothetical protein